MESEAQELTFTNTPNIADGPRTTLWETLLGLEKAQFVTQTGRSPSSFSLSLSIPKQVFPCLLQISWDSQAQWYNCYISEISWAGCNRPWWDDLHHGNWSMLLVRVSPLWRARFCSALPPPDPSLVQRVQCWGWRLRSLPYPSPISTEENSRENFIPWRLSSGGK